MATFFGIDVTAVHGGATWRVYRRYSEFHRVYCDANRPFNEHFPPKTFFPPTEPSDLEIRRQKLELWLRTLTRALLAGPLRLVTGSLPAGSYEIDGPLRAFLEYDQHKPSIKPKRDVPEAGPAVVSDFCSGQPAEGSRVMQRLRRLLYQEPSEDLRVKGRRRRGGYTARAARGCGETDADARGKVSQ